MFTSMGIDTAMSATKASAYEAAVMMKNAGFDCADFGINFDDRKAFMEGKTDNFILQKYDGIKEAGLFVGQVHLPYLPNGTTHLERNNYQSFEDYMLEPLIKSLELCRKMECGIAVLHLYYGDDSEDTYNSNIKLINKLLPALQKYEIVLALENIYAHDGKNYLNSFVAYPEDVMKYINYFDSKYIRACLDTGHANIFKINVIEAVQLYGKKLVALHTNANAGGDQHAIPMTVPGWLDHTDYSLFAQTLAKVGYVGTMNFEITSGSVTPGAGKAFIELAGCVAKYMAEVYES